MRFKTAITCLALALAGCDNSDTCDAGCIPVEGGPDVFVANQGNFAAGNGTLARLRDGGSIDSTGALGGLLQSATLHAGRIYVTVNTANRIDVFDAETMARVAQFEVPAPRYIAFVSDSKAYVTSQFYDFGGSVRPDLVTVIDPRDGTTTDTIQVGGNAEGLGIVGGRAYVATGAFSESSRVVVLDTSTDAIIDEIDVGCSPRHALPDGDGDVFIVCAGAAGGDEVVVLDGASGAEEARIPLGAAVTTFGPGQDAHLSAEAHLLHVVLEGGLIRRIDTRLNAGTMTLGVFGSDPVGAVAYDAESRRLYAAHAPAGFEFVAGGYVRVLDAGGSEIARVRSGGVAPSHLIIRPRI